ncbi:unnamed protein product, partial [Rotaria sordida]
MQSVSDPIDFRGVRKCAAVPSVTKDYQHASPYKNEYPDAIMIAGFILDWIGSLAPTLIGLIIAFILAIFALRTLVHLCCSNKNRVRSSDDSSVTVGCAVFLLCSRPMNRFVALNCNCPCYIPRPRLRFLVRLALLLFAILLRVLAIILYATSKTNTASKATLAFACAFSIIFPLSSISLDFYQYRVWWHYRPSCDTLPRSTLSKKHIRYIPYHLVGNNRNDMHMGNKPCDTMSPDVKCRNRNLEHLIIFHLDDYKPQERWGILPPSEAANYVGFHRTKAEFAISIAHSDFRPSMTPPQMLGFGVYFARSIEHTKGKARNAGALICAEIRMGRVKQITVNQIDTVRNSKAWWKNYDTVYYNHENDDRDEFCIKDPAQILRWVIV